MVIYWYEKVYMKNININHNLELRLQQRFCFLWVYAYGAIITEIVFHKSISTVRLNEDRCSSTQYLKFMWKSRLIFNSLDL